MEACHSLYWLHYANFYRQAVSTGTECFATRLFDYRGRLNRGCTRPIFGFIENLTVTDTANRLNIA